MECCPIGASVPHVIYIFRKSESNVCIALTKNTTVAQLFVKAQYGVLPGMGVRQHISLQGTLNSVSNDSELFEVCLI